MATSDLSKLRIDKSGPAGGPRRRRIPNTLLIAVGAAALLAAAFLLFHSRAAEVRTALVSRVYPSQAFTLLNASGYVVAQRKAAVAATTTGRLVWIGVEEGSPVSKGEVITRLEDREETAALNRATANLANARAALVEAKAELKVAGMNYNRNRELLKKGFIAQMDFDAAEARHARAEAVVAGAESAVQAAEAAVQAATVDLEYTRIRAPFTGVVLTKDADVGDIITPLGAAANAKASVVTMADMSSLQVEADVAESNLSKVRVGQACEIQLDALPDDRFPGTVHMIVPTADRTKGTVLVKVRFLERDPRILPEMSARVGFLSRPVSPEERTPVTAVNPAALLERAGKTLAFVVKDNIVSVRSVTPGGPLGDLVVIREGLQPGEKVVVDPPESLKEGSRISEAEP